MNARLLLDSKDFERNMRKSKMATQDFRNTAQTATADAARSIQSMLSAWGKIGAVVGAATSAYKIYERVMNSTGSSQMAFKARQEGVNAAVDSFFESLNNGDISGFLGRMRTAYSSAEKLAGKLERLQAIQAVAANEGQGFEYDKARAERIIKNPESTQAEIDSAVNDLRKAIGEYGKLNEFTSQKNKDAQAAILDKAYTNWARVFMGEYFPTIEYTTAEGLAFKGGLKNPQEKVHRPAVDKDEVLAIVEATLKSSEALDKALSFSGYAAAADRIKAQPLMTDTGWYAQNYGRDTYVTKEVATLYDKTKMAGLLAVKIIQNLTSEERALYTTLQSEIDSSGKKMEDESRAMEEIIKGASSARSASVAAEEKTAAELEKAAAEAAEAAQTWSALTHVADVGQPVGISFATNLTPREKVGNKMNEYFDATTNPAGKLPSTIAMLPGNPAQGALDYMDSQFLKDVERKAQVLDNVNSIVGTLGSSFQSLGSSIGGASGQMLSFVGFALEAAQAIIPLIAQIMAEKVAHEKNATAATLDAGSKALSAHAGIPFAGVAMGVAAVAGIVASMRSIPKLAEGGIVDRATLGIFGEAGPEAVMPLDKLNQYIQPREVRVTGAIKASGKELVVVLDNYNRVREVRRNGN